MKFAIPLAEGKLTTHFGHCKMFALITVDDNTKAITKKEEIVPPPHEPGLLPVWLHERGVTHVIAGGLGQKARVLMEEKNICVLAGAPALEPETLVNQHLAGTLTFGANGCDH
jgi:ATP-binding protein involved in chromosome partitioning